MNKGEVQKLFGGIVCPHCKQEIYITDGSIEDAMKEFQFFHTTSDNPRPGCLEFNDTLNEFLVAIRNGRLPEQEFLLWAKQYNSQSNPL